MSANLTHDYLQAEEALKSATTHSEKIQALEVMLRTIPKHKRTEKMQADIKRRLSHLRKESQKRKPTTTQKPFYHIEREGAGHVILCGPANSGKSQLLAKLTHAHPEITDYPFTTRAPQPGMMHFEDIQIQLVDTPPLAPEIIGSWQLAMIQQADGAVLLFDINDPNLLDQTEFVLKVFDDRGIRLSQSEKPWVKTLGNKIDAPQGNENFEAWQELYKKRLSTQPFSSFSDEALGHLKQHIFRRLDIVRVYTKAPGKKPVEDSSPFVLKRGSTIMDAARAIHKDISQTFKFARVWGKIKFEGQMVERNYVLEDGDLLEIHN